MLNNNKIKRVAKILGKVILSFLFIFTVSTSRPIEAKEMNMEGMNPCEMEMGKMDHSKMKSENPCSMKMDMKGMDMKGKNPCSMKMGKMNHSKMKMNHKKMKHGGKSK